MKVITLFAILVVLMMGVVYGVMFATGDEKADMNGNIIGICPVSNHESNTYCSSILVEGMIAGNSQNQNLSVKITNETNIIQKQGEKRNKANYNDLKPGQKVAIMFTGPFVVSYPPQTTAKEIIILS
jgi:Protein of unknown function (DUF3221)